MPWLISDVDKYEFIEEKGIEITLPIETQKTGW